MKFVILGADGQLGQEWGKYLSAQKADFSLFEFSDLDITDFDKLDQTVCSEKPSVLVNCAAYTAVDKAEEEVELANLINHLAVDKLAKLCKKYHVKLVHYSTDYVFAGNSTDHTKYPNGYPEDAIPNPINEYGISKLKGEQAIINSGCEYLILRLSWLCGANGNNFVKAMLSLAKQRDTLKVVNDQFGAPTFTEQTVLDSLGLINLSCKGIYHLGSDGIISWYEFAKAIFEISDVDIQINPVESSKFPTVATRPNFSKLSTRKIEQELHRVSNTWMEGLKNLLNQIKNDY